MMLGSVCTRNCGFCAIDTGRPPITDLDEPRRVAEATKQMNLKHVVVTMVARDDLPDGGARMVAETIRQIRLENPGTSIEVLISDLNGRPDDIRTVVEAQPDILNHNVETVPRLQRAVRRRARWDRSVSVLARARLRGWDRLRRDGHEDRDHARPRRDVGRGRRGDATGARGRHRRPHDRSVPAPIRQHLPLDKYYTPAEFMALRRIGLEMGFRHVQSGPLVRSSYHAAEQVPGQAAAAS